MSTIQVPVTFRQTPDGRVVARRASVPDEAEGATEAEALANLQAEAVAPDGPRLEPIRRGDGPHPWVAMVGWLPDDELTAAWKQAMADRRAELAAQELAEEEAATAEEPT